jgi:hypothetical protein
MKFYNFKLDNAPRRRDAGRFFWMNTHKCNNSLFDYQSLKDKKATFCHYFLK